MNRSWFRNPFGGSRSSDGIEEEEMLGDEADQVINRSSGSDKGRRKKRRNNKAASDTSATNTSTSFASSSRGDIEEERAPVPPLPSPALSSGGQAHAHAHSLHSISSIRTAHFAEGKSPGSPEGSTEASPSKTPLHDRLSRLSWASTASGMMKFDDEDREEAERRWAEMEEVSEEHGPEDYMPKLRPSRSSTSIKSILKKSVAEGLCTPHRTVTFSPSTHPAAPTPPEVSITPEHPRLHALRANQQEGSPLQHTYVADDSLLGSDESREVEDALLSRSSISPTTNESTDPLRIQGSSRKPGALDRMQAVIPSPDSSLVAVRQVTNEASNLLDMSAPSHLQEMTVTDERSRLKASAGPRPFFLRQSIIVEESSVAPTSPGSTTQDFHSFATIASPTASLRDSVHSRAGISRMGATVRKEEPSLVRQTSVDEPGRLQETAETVNERDIETPPEARALVPLPTMTPSSSSSSMKPVNADSPFTSLVSHLLSTQDELLSHRADQKSVLLSLINNLRGELASRDRLVSILEKQKAAVEEKFRRERKLEQERLENAVIQMENTREKLTAEVQRRDDALREELLHERTRRELLEGQLEQMGRNDSRGHQTETTRLEQELAQSEDRAQAAESHAQSLQDQLAAAEMQITRLSGHHEAEVQDLRTRLHDVSNTLDQERLEQARQSASVHEELARERQQIYQLEKDKEQMHRELVSLKNDSAKLLHHREHQQQERTKFLESEVVRLREVVSKMRLESADREVKVVRLQKGMASLQGDIDGLNIALEAKQQEVMLLKRASAEITGTVRRPARSRPSSTQDTVLKSSTVSAAANGQSRINRRISFQHTKTTKALEAASLMPEEDKENRRRIPMHV